MRGEDTSLRADARLNRIRLIEAAQDAFALQGPSVPIDEIARRAGVGVGTVYRHFPAKEDLFAAIVRLRFQRVVEEAHARAAAQDGGAAFSEFLRMLIDEGAVKRDLVDALTRAGIDVKTTILEEARELRQAVGVLLSRAQAAGAVRRDIGTEEVMALLTGLIRAVEGPGGSPRRIDRLAAVLFDGLRPPLTRTS